METGVFVQNGLCMFLSKRALGKRVWAVWACSVKRNGSLLKKCLHLNGPLTKEFHCVMWHPFGRAHAALWSKHFIRVLALDLISARAAKVLSFGGARILIERILVLWWCLGLSCTGLFV